MSAWILLAFSIVLEICGTTLLKLSDGFDKPLIGFAAIAAYTGSLWLFAPALKVIPIGIAYAIWAGAGIMTVSVIGFFFFNQSLGALQYLFIALILIGAVGLRLTTTIDV
ncbi:MAG: multidrug efflux SMR transporter [Pseudomonadota bacterium]